MNISRKKGLNKIRIVGHNKVLLYWIIALTILLIFVIYLIVKIDNNPASKGIIIEKNASIECKSDSDCTKIQTSCCSCNMGGKEICGNLEEKEYFETKLKGICSQKIICPAVYSCGIKSCSCSNNKCIEIR